MAAIGKKQVLRVVGSRNGKKSRTKPRMASAAAGLALFDLPVRRQI
ncbi:MAG TPA: hypothetical protein VD865_16120 [Stenotrophomonas sp.]|nr:hypothetical protein [Stenotrophomonas sp.]